MTAARDERPATAEAFVARRQARRIARLEVALREALQFIGDSAEDGSPSRSLTERLRKVLS